jgi:hypothetical protein
MFWPHFPTHWEELVSILTTRVWRLVTTFSHVIVWLLTELIASWASFFTSIWLLFEIHLQWIDHILEILLLKTQLSWIKLLNKVVDESVKIVNLILHWVKKTYFSETIENFVSNIDNVFARNLVLLHTKEGVVGVLSDHILFTVKFDNWNRTCLTNRITNR